MAGSTTNLGLTKPTYSEDADIAVINNNMDTLDSKIGAVGSTSLQAQITSASEAIAKKANMDVFTTQSALNTFCANLPVDRTAVCALGGDVTNALVGISSYALVTIVKVSGSLVHILYAISNQKRIGSLVYNFSTSAVTNNNDLNEYIANITFDLTDKTNYTGDVYDIPYGCYRVATTAANLPVAHNGFIFAIYRAASSKALQYFDDNGGVYVNLKSGGTWGGWKQLAPKSDVTVSASSSTTLTNASVSKSGDLCGGTVQIKISVAANTWITIGSISAKPSYNLTVPAVRTGTGAYIGMVTIESSTGNIQLYANAQLTNHDVSFTFAYKVA